MANITVILQAASDSRMTATNSPGGNLPDHDPRKMYGLPNMFIDQDDRLCFKAKPRWDEVAEESQIPTDAPSPVYKTKGPFVKPNPTTTAFQLKCDSISHDFMDMTQVSPIPAFDIRDGSHESTGTPGQLNNIVVALGLRTEVIKLSGMLVDRGPVSAENPRRQTLLNIARTQYLKITRGGKAYGQDVVTDTSRSNAGWGGAHSSPLNPRSFPCLSLFHDINVLNGTGGTTQNFNFGYSIGTEPSGDSRQYRGIIKDLTFELQGGRPDIWKWDMTFLVVNNEHAYRNLLKPEWNYAINRIRLVDAVPADTSIGSSEVTAANGFGFVEVRFTNTPRTFTPNPDDPNGDDLVKHTMGWNDKILITGANSTPTINGWWYVRYVDVSARTAILSYNFNDEFGVDTVWSNQYNRGNAANADTGYLEWQSNQWTDGNAGNCMWSVPPDVNIHELLLLP